MEPQRCPNAARDAVPTGKADMRKFLGDAATIATIVIAIILVGLASRGRLPGLSWEQQFTVYLILIGAMVGIIVVVVLIAFIQNWIER
jgi:hypothetical protein